MYIRHLLGIALLCLTAHATLAEEVVIPVGQQGKDKASLATPQKGLTMEAVETTFGSPKSKTDPVGDPPISSWEYEYYRVYFESDRVIHTVLKPYSEDQQIAPATGEE
jgi:hypothetical protein